MEAATQPALDDWRAMLFSQLLAESGGAGWGLTQAQFFALLDRVCAKQKVAEEETRKFVASLRIQELALVGACLCGYEQAWTEFLNRYRAILYQAAYSIAGDEATGRELADSLYAELWGVNSGSEAANAKPSKLTYYSGRGSLEGWLRTLLAQEYVNRFRRNRRLVSFEERMEAGEQFSAPSEELQTTPDARIERATDAALAALDAESRYLLAAYFLDGCTLAQLGRTLGTHESTVSRKLEKILRGLRKQILRKLAAEGMSPRAAEEALQIDIRDLAVNVQTRLRPPPAETPQPVGEISPDAPPGPR